MISSKSVIQCSRSTVECIFLNKIIGITFFLNNRVVSYTETSQRPWTANNDIWHYMMLKAVVFLASFAILLAKNYAILRSLCTFSSLKAALMTSVNCTSVFNGKESYTSKLLYGVRNYLEIYITFRFSIQSCHCLEQLLLLKLIFLSSMQTNMFWMYWARLFTFFDPFCINSSNRKYFQYNTFWLNKLLVFTANSVHYLSNLYLLSK